MSKTIHVVSILDRSGSMTGTEKEVIGAYNNFIEEQKKIAMDNGVKIKASLVLFDDRYDEIYSKVPLSKVEKLTEEVYTTRGMTALFDAVGKTISRFDDKKNVLMFIETDGRENSSREYNSKSLKELVSKKEKEGWDFNFVGADLDSATTSYLGSSMGISKSMNFAKSNAGYKSRNMAFASSTVAYVDKVQSST